MPAPSITDPLFRTLYAKIAEEIDNRVNGLARGSALILGANTGLDINTTALKYQAAVSYIEALQFVLELGLELDNERYNSKRSAVDE